MSKSENKLNGIFKVILKSFYEAFFLFLIDTKLNDERRLI